MFVLNWEKWNMRRSKRADIKRETNIFWKYIDGYFFHEMMWWYRHWKKRVSMLLLATQWLLLDILNPTWLILKTLFSHQTLLNWFEHYLLFIFYHKHHNGMQLLNNIIVITTWEFWEAEIRVLWFENKYTNKSVIKHT